MRPIERKHVYWHCICGSEAESALESVSPDSRPFMLRSLWPSCCNLYCFSTDERIWWFPWRKIEPVTVCLERCQVRWKESWTWIWKRYAWPWESHLVLWRSSFPVSQDQAWNEPFWCLRMLRWLSDSMCVRVFSVLSSMALIHSAPYWRPVLYCTHTAVSKHWSMLKWTLHFHRETEQTKQKCNLQARGEKCYGGKKARERYRDTDIPDWTGKPCWGGGRWAPATSERRRTNPASEGSQLLAEQRVVIWAQRWKPSNPALYKPSPFCEIMVSLNASQLLVST